MTYVITKILNRDPMSGAAMTYKPYEVHLTHWSRGERVKRIFAYRTFAQAHDIATVCRQGMPLQNGVELWCLGYDGDAPQLKMY